MNQYVINTFYVSASLIFLLSFICFTYFEFSNPSNGSPVDDKHRIQLKGNPVISSVWCSGYNSSERFCVFQNLCYSLIFKDFIFYHGKNSQISGIPTDIFEAAVAELSSVRNHNTQFFQYVDLPSVVQNESEIFFVDTPTVLFSRFHPDNIMHVFHDDLLPLYSTLGMICKRWYDNSVCDISILFTDGKPWGPFELLYKVMFKNVELIQNLSGFKQICFKNVHVGVNKETVWYQYGFKYPQGPVTVQDPARIVSYIQHFRSYFYKLFVNELPVKTEENILIVTRKSNRRILNANAMGNLIKNITKYSVKMLNLEDYKLTEIVSYIQHSCILIGMHGSLLILALFLRPKSILIEMFPYAVNPSHYTPYKTLAQLPGMHIIYESWQNHILENSFSYPDNPAEMGGISHLPLHEQKAILKSEEVPPHVCCDNSEWLFRIYQDTIVDLNSFHALLEKALAKRERLNGILGSSDKLQLHPTKVSDPVCSINLTTESLTVKWKEPWNIPFLNIQKLEYELWIQSKPASNADDVKVYILSKTYHVFSNVDINIDYLMWVKCIGDEKSGPFINACECSKSV